MKINIYHLLEGAREADGLTVIIDVFRAFSLECYLYAMGAREIRPVGRIEEAFAWKNEDPDCLLAGERGGKMCEGFDFGNSPSAAEKIDVRGKRIIHTTSAGTQGIVNAVHAEEIIGGALVNARAVAAYIKRRNPEKVSLVCMGNGGVRPAAEDELCAEYIRALLLGEEIPDFDERVQHLRIQGGEHFFDPERQEIFPEADFWRCIEYDKFDFVVRIERDERGLVARMVDAQDEELDRLFSFFRLIDREKFIGRQTYLTDGKRKENDAEHAWHMAIMTVLLAKYANEEIDVLKTVTMLLIHDLVEIYAGDTYAYDDAGKETQAAREREAAEKVYGTLPKEQGEWLKGIWLEFEAQETPEAKFARTMDNLQPMMLNDSTNGISWVEHGVHLSQILKRNERTHCGSEVLWEYAKENFLMPHVEKGHIIKD